MPYYIIAHMFTVETTLYVFGVVVCLCLPVLKLIVMTVWPHKPRYATYIRRTRFVLLVEDEQKQRKSYEQYRNSQEAF